jgi:hypothetical protein
MTRWAVIAEGRSDWHIMASVIKDVYSDANVDLIQPEYLGTGGRPNGWRGVQAWCEKYREIIGEFMDMVKGREYQHLVIQLDCSMAHNVNAAKAMPPARDTANALRDVVVKKWLNRRSLEKFIVLSVPAMCSEAWLVSALEPAYTPDADIECDINVKMELFRRKFLKLRDGEPKYNRDAYDILCKSLIDQTSTVTNRCPEYKRFRAELAASDPR